MATSVEAYDFDLPESRIGQRLSEPRDACRLLVLNRSTGMREHRIFRDIIAYLEPGDLLVWNNTKVFKARLFGRLPSGVEIEVFLLRHEADGVWQTLMRPGRKACVGDIVQFADDFSCVVVDKYEDGRIAVRFELDAAGVRALANQYGHIPVPPYVDTEPTEIEQYQTVYARAEGSVAAPTAGFHFTDGLIAQLRDRGVRFAEVTLHVGIGTFQPMKTDMIEDHEMHSEWVEVTRETVELIAATRHAGKRVIAVGTTTVRTLEGVALAHAGVLTPFIGDVNCFIKPGFTFRVIDAMITNFHLPKSTLLVLVSAFAGKDLVLDTYQEAIDREYAFYSFGDAMLIV
jgi:S-adenosylmethionine:tRNA ribosyltransferase-isomerase